MPFDPDIEEMDPITKIYLYYHWIEDQNENIEFYKNHGYLIGSFFNPEAVARLMQTQKMESSDEDFEKASEMIRQEIDRETKGVKERKRKKRKKALEG